jgi:hypothetical protein
LSDLFGIRIPHVSKVIHDIFGEISDEVQKTVKKSLKLTKQTHKNLNGMVSCEDSNLQLPEEFIQTTSRKHQQHIKTLLGFANDLEAANSGLQLISHNQTLVWACNAPDEECQRCREGGVGDLSLPCGDGEAVDRYHWTQTQTEKEF